MLKNDDAITKKFEESLSFFIGLYLKSLFLNIHI